MSTKPLIDAPGLYLTRDGRTVKATARDDDQYPWLATYEGGGVMLHRPNGRSHAQGYHADDYDIVAKAVPATKPRPAKGKKAKRRYVTKHDSRRGIYWVQDTNSGAYIGVCLSRADARAFAAMKEAQRGGA